MFPVNDKFTKVDLAFPAHVLQSASSSPDERWLVLRIVW